jgi:hypothetical protein
MYVTRNKQNLLQGKQIVMVVVKHNSTLVIGLFIMVVTGFGHSCPTSGQLTGT